MNNKDRMRNQCNKQRDEGEPKARHVHFVVCKFPSSCALVDLQSNIKTFVDMDSQHITSRDDKAHVPPGQEALLHNPVVLSNSR